MFNWEASAQVLDRSVRILNGGSILHFCRRESLTHHAAFNEFVLVSFLQDWVDLMKTLYCGLNAPPNSGTVAPFGGKQRSAGFLFITIRDPQENDVVFLLVRL